MPEARLHVVGWPPGWVSPEIQHVGKGTLSVEPWLSSEELADRMARASVLVIASQFEVAPILLAEAWAVGLPVVVTPVGGLPALATGAATVVTRRTPEELAEGIVRALKGGKEVEQLVAEARRRAEAHRVDAVVGAHIALYNEVIQKR
jgi:glycosyltransferase involved in cell wall biosynthesis